ncbi:serine hydrolase [Actinomycetospora lutea]|uniref:serine hydrolase domain-containing protein n=1 Tax=Actinomycetospora lutea TaxID=663604 RepID=UPI0023653B88|nr:serine hydrolase [Actinomycetospora lutea]MDD7942611.1 serine hydrolase [Actinomycetospora lutea]
MARTLRRLAAALACAATVLVALPITAPPAPAATPAPAAASAPAATPSPDLAAVDRYLADALPKTGVPGTAVAITRGTDVVHLAGFGTDSRGAPITPDTRFRIASLSKTFTATAVLQLAAAGRVDLDAPVRRYLPDFTLADRALSARITVRHLLHQTSGIADTAFPAVTDDDGDLRRRVASLRTATPANEPGAAFHYADPNYQVLALLIEDITGEPWADHLGRHLFAPLGMTRTDATAATTTTTGAGAGAPDLPDGHVLVFDRPVARPELTGLLAGSGGVVSTARDVARWLIAQSTGEGPAMPPGSRALLQTPPLGSTYAMGWQVVTPDVTPDATPEQGPRRIEHTGVLSTFSAVQVLLPDSGYAFALLFDANSALADTAGLTTGLATLLAGTGEPAPPRSTGLVSAVIGGLCVLVVAARARALTRLDRGHPRSEPLRLAWLLLPIGVLAALSPLVAAATGRVFTTQQIALAMPDVLILLVLAAVTGAALAAARLRARRTTRR